MDCAAEMRDLTQITEWKTGADFGNITPARRLETMTGLAGNFDRREQFTAFCILRMRSSSGIDDIRLCRKTCSGTSDSCIRRICGVLLGLFWFFRSKTSTWSLLSQSRMWRY